VEMNREYHEESPYIFKATDFGEIIGKLGEQNFGNNILPSSGHFRGFPMLWLQGLASSPQRLWR
jgi:hypothetical protein